MDSDIIHIQSCYGPLAITIPLVIYSLIHEMELQFHIMRTIHHMK